MKCPFCDIEMLQGYLNCGMTLWSERKHKISLLADGKEKYALCLGRPLVSPHHIKSHCCPKCKKIIIDAEDYENNLD
jgi:hypothetical protein